MLLTRCLPAGICTALRSTLAFRTGVELPSTVARHQGCQAYSIGRRLCEPAKTFGGPEWRLAGVQSICQKLQLGLEIRLCVVRDGEFAAKPRGAQPTPRNDEQKECRGFRLS